MKIGIFTDSYLPQINGVTYTLVLWKKELEKLGHEVFVYYPEDSAYTPKKNEIPLTSLPFLFYKGYKIGLPSFKKIEKGLDIIHLQSPATMADLGLAVSRKQGIPCIMTYHTPPDRYMYEILPVNNELLQEALRMFYYKYEKELLKRVWLVTSPSEEIINILKERWGKRIKKAVFFSNGIDTEYFKEADGERFRKDFNIPPGKVIGYTGRHSIEKHLEDLINYADTFDGTVLIGGDGPQGENYKKMAEGKKNIRFLGFFPRDRLCEFYSLLDVFIMPSTAETEGLVVLEANSCGTPAVGANAMALKSTIREGVNGYHYEPGDLKGLDAAVKRAYANAESLKRSSKEFVQDRSGAKTAKRLVKLYEETIAEYKKEKARKKPRKLAALKIRLPKKTKTKK